MADDSAVQISRSELADMFDVLSAGVEHLEQQKKDIDERLSRAKSAWEFICERIGREDLKRATNHIKE